MNQALKNPSQLKNVEVKEVEGEEEYCEECDPNKEEMNEWVKKVIEKNYHAVATKGAILETIKVKIQEKATMIPMPGKAKKGHNGIPEFMTYESSSDGDVETKPSKPKVTPGTKPKPHNPNQPGPFTKPKPKAEKK
jgi:hypothetical protein